MAHPCNLNTGVGVEGLRQEDCYKFKTSLDYRVRLLHSEIETVGRTIFPFPFSDLILGLRVVINRPGATLSL